MKSVIKVGIFATICLVVLGLLIWKIEDFNPFQKKGQRVDALFTSVAGLDDKASVRIAGVRVGQITSIGLAPGKDRPVALVKLQVQKSVPVPTVSFCGLSSARVMRAFAP